MAFNVKEHIAAVGEFAEFIGEDAYFNEFIAARDPTKGFIYEKEQPEEQEEQDEGVEEFDEE